MPDGKGSANCQYRLLTGHRSQPPKGSFGSEEITIKRSPDRSSSSTGTGKNNNCISPNCRHFPCRWIISRPHTPMVACMSPGVRANGPNRSGRFANRPYEPTLFITANTVASKGMGPASGFPRTCPSTACPHGTAIRGWHTTLSSRRFPAGIRPSGSHCLHRYAFLSFEDKTVEK